MTAPEFSALVGVEPMEACDADKVSHAYLNTLDVATKFSTFIRVDSKDSGEVASLLLESWITWAGAPDHIIHDQGREFFRHFGHTPQKKGIASTIAATKAPWQRGMVERHGQALAEVLSVMVDQCQLTGPVDMRMGGMYRLCADGMPAWWRAGVDRPLS